MARKIKGRCFYDGGSYGLFSQAGSTAGKAANAEAAEGLNAILNQYEGQGGINWASAGSAIANDFINNELIPYMGYSSRSKVNEYKRQLQGINQSIWNSDFNSNADLMQAYKTANLDNPYYEYEGMDVGQGLLFGLKRMSEGAAIGTSIVPGWGTLIGAAAGIVDAGIQSTVKNASAYKKMASARQAYDDAVMDRQRALNYGIKQINTKNNMLEEFNYADMGGPLNHGTEWSDNVILVDNGGTHEQNPYGGVLMGVDAEGIPNLVEEGEVIWNNYVFSNRLKVPMSVRKKFNLKKNGGPLTYAEAVRGSKQFKALEEMPNDSITKDSFEAFIANLAMSQEEERAKDKMQKSNRFDWGGFMEGLRNYQYSKQKGGKEGTYKIDHNMHKSLGFDNIKALEDSREYQAFTQFVLSNPSNPKVQEYLRALDEGTHSGVEKLFNSKGELQSNWRTLYEKRRTDGRGGIYHFSGNDINDFRGLTDARISQQLLSDQIEEVPVTITDNDIYGDLDAEVLGLDVPISTDDYKTKVKTKSPIGVEALRYAPVFGNLAAMLGTSATPVDYSNIARYENFGLNAPMVSTHPIGNYMEYKPFDINYAANRLGARAANRRRLLSDLSGGNAATARANIIASDYEAQNDIGDLLIAAADSNLKQRINRDTFNRETDKYNSTDAARADAANVSIWNTKLQALMRGASEREALDARRSLALSQNATAFSENLGNIGREEFIFNQLDNNPALLYRYLSRNGQIGYSGSKGGLLTVKKIRRK